MNNLKEELYALLSFEKSQDANFNDGALYEWIRDGKTYVSKLSPDQIAGVTALFESYVKANKAQIKALVVDLIQEAFDKNLSTKQLMEMVEAL